MKNKTGVNFKGEIVKNKDTIDLVGDFHCSTQFKILYITAAILVALCACYIALSDFVKVWVVMAEILISLFVYINLVNDDNKKFIIINLLTKEINQISSKKFDYSYLYNEAEGYYDLDELYKEVDTSLKVQKKNKIIWHAAEILIYPDYNYYRRQHCRRYPWRHVGPFAECPHRPVRDAPAAAAEGRTGTAAGPVAAAGPGVGTGNGRKEQSPGSQRKPAPSSGTAAGRCQRPHTGDTAGSGADPGRPR